MIAPPLLKPEYNDRLARVRGTMTTRGLDAPVIGNPENINWLNVYDAWSFYAPQMTLIDMQDGPFWMGLGMDARAIG